MSADQENLKVRFTDTSGVEHVETMESQEDLAWIIWEGNVASIELPEGMTRVPYRAFRNNGSLRSVELPSTMETINAGDFEGCTELESVRIREGTREIDTGAFVGCTALKSVELPDSVEVIGYEAFAGCTMLKSVRLPENLREIGAGAFAGCISLDEIRFPDSLDNIPAACCVNCSGLRSAKLPKDLKSVGNFAFENCWSLSDVTLPEERIGTIGTGAFRYDLKLDKDRFRPAREDSVMPGAFDFTKDMPDGVTMTLADGSVMTGRMRAAELRDICMAADEAGGLVSVKLPEGMSYLESDSLSGLGSLKKLELPGSMRKIEVFAVHDCPNLAEIAFDRNRPPEVPLIEATACDYDRAVSGCPAGDVLEEAYSRYRDAGSAGRKPVRPLPDIPDELLVEDRQHGDGGPDLPY